MSRQRFTVRWLLNHIERFYRPQLRRRRKRRVASSKRLVELLYANRDGLYPEDLAEELGVKPCSLYKIIAKAQAMLPEGYRIVSVLYTKHVLRWTRFKLIVPKPRQRGLFTEGSWS